jgi:hypothetical protein
MDAGRIWVYLLLCLFTDEEKMMRLFEVPPCIRTNIV